MLEYLPWYWVRKLLIGYVTESLNYNNIAMHERTKCHNPTCNFSSQPMHMHKFRAVTPIAMAAGRALPAINNLDDPKIGHTATGCCYALADQAYHEVNLQMFKESNTIRHR